MWANGAKSSHMFRDSWITHDIIVNHGADTIVGPCSLHWLPGVKSRNNMWKNNMVSRLPLNQHLDIPDLARIVIA